MAKWMNKEQMKEYIIGIIIYSICFSLISLFWGAGLVAMNVSAFFLLLFFLNSRREYSQRAIIGVFTFFAVLFLGITFFDIKYIKFYIIGLLISYLGMLLLHNTKTTKCIPIKKPLSKN